MAINRQQPLAVDDNTIDQLRTQGGMSQEEARALMRQEGLDGLRIRVAARLYATIPLTSWEAAERVGLRNRGLLLRYLQENCIGAAPDPNEDAARIMQELDARMDARLTRWQRTAQVDSVIRCLARRHPL
ncbi:MAG: hypothetical protein M0Z53_12705 [Thermaerobacter sp.]|nr:hypothetical protein [Thermaerobacter sp.]